MAGAELMGRHNFLKPFFDDALKINLRIKKY